MSLKDTLAAKQDDGQDQPPVTGEAVAKTGKFGRLFYVDPEVNLVSESGDRMPVVNGFYVAKSQADQDQLEYHAANGTIVAVGE